MINKAQVTADITNAYIDNFRRRLHELEKAEQALKTASKYADAGTLPDPYNPEEVLNWYRNNE